MRKFAVLFALLALVFAASASAQAISNFQTRMKTCMQNNLGAISFLGMPSAPAPPVTYQGHSAGGGGTAYIYQGSGMSHVIYWWWIQNNNGTNGLDAIGNYGSSPETPTAGERSTAVYCLNTSDDGSAQIIGPNYYGSMVYTWK